MQSVRRVLLGTALVLGSSLARAGVIDFDSLNEVVKDVSNIASQSFSDRIKEQLFDTLITEFDPAAGSPSSGNYRLKLSSKLLSGIASPLAGYSVSMTTEVLSRAVESGKVPVDVTVNLLSHGSTQVLLSETAKRLLEKFSGALDDDTQSALLDLLVNKDLEDVFGIVSRHRNSLLNNSDLEPAERAFIENIALSYSPETGFLLRTPISLEDYSFDTSLLLKSDGCELILRANHKFTEQDHNDLSSGIVSFLVSIVNREADTIHELDGMATRFLEAGYYFAYGKLPPLKF